MTSLGKHTWAVLWVELLGITAENLLSRAAGKHKRQILALELPHLYPTKREIISTNVASNSL